ncbi:hypothetical protein CKO15_09885 [Halorhodospira abdelmalekii]|uniref:WGR domain-containing protein n=1 Tax=Halorhodospira abdelmalekii TaxID=421629 RepID=UPI0019047045|nr:WGR domain-containing protein [Halorhodospira abdelmalekii]MBK1735588.1 hypothetical protein [Halorhodospira abdelmalekii]
MLKQASEQLPASIELEKIDPARNQNRYYVVALEADFFAAVRLVRRWGRIGNRGGQSMVEPYDCLDAALDAVRKHVLGKLRRGYRIRAAAPLFLQEPIADAIPDRAALGVAAGLTAIHDCHRASKGDGAAVPELLQVE